MRNDLAQFRRWVLKQINFKTPTPPSTPEWRAAEDLEPEHRELLIPFGASGYLLLYRAENLLVYIQNVCYQKEAEY